MSLKDLFNKKDPPVCGGNDTTIDPKAPKKILSDDMTLFDVTSALDRDYHPSEKDDILDNIGYVSAFAVPAGDNTFLYLEAGEYFQRLAEKSHHWALVRNSIFPSLVELVRERDIAKNNGYHSRTHGLPEDFGGSMDIRYSSGETISISDNGSPIIRHETGVEIAKIFFNAMNGEKAELPDVSLLKEIRFEELRDNGGFTKAVLTIQPNGTGVSSKQSKYDSPTVYKREKNVDESTIAAIKKNIEETGILAWSDVPSNGYSFNKGKQMEFVFKDDRRISVKSDRLLPYQIGNGFFNIELELVTKH